MPTPSGPQIDPSPAEKFFGLSSRPFSLTPDLRFSYHSRSHTHALEQVTTALKRREGLIVVTGAIGTGKTMLCRSMLESFEPRTFLSVILDPGLEVEDLLRSVLTDFGIMGGMEVAATGPLSEISRHQFVSTLQQFLSSLVPLGAHAVIMIDEAQRLNSRVLEEIRLLTNFETDEAKLLQIVLVGQPELDDILGQPAMQQLNQRVARRCELQPLSETEVGDYIERRLTVAAALAPSESGGGPAPDPSTVVRFEPDAVEAVAELSHGTPRLINTICDKALDAAYERHVRVVTREAVLDGANRLRIESPGELLEHKDRHLAWIAAALAALLIAGLAAWWWLPRPPALIPARAPATRTPAAPNRGAALPPDSPPAPTETAAPAPRVPAAATSNPAPPPAAPSPAVATPRPTPAPRAPAAAGTFQVTVASFRTEQRAKDVVATVTAMQVPVALVPDSTGTWFRVVAGPFNGREAAVAAQQQLARSGFDGTQIGAVVPEAR